MDNFMFSIVMAVYNVEEFLAEAIESVIAQDISFEENVQLILVDDGSQDTSGEICDRYQAKYPKNIVTIHKENGGVSSARNEGLKYAKGKYINFLDSDDKLSKNTLRLVRDFFDKNSAYVDVATIPMHFFDAATGDHILNYKFFNGTKVIDLNRDYTSIVLSTSSSFIKKEKIGRFDEKLDYCEDAKILIEVLANKQTLGVISGCKYLYRRRQNGNSAVQNSQTNKNWYLSCTEHFMLKTLLKAKHKYGYIPKFIQYTICYYLQWYLLLKNGIIQQVLSINEEEKFYELISLIVREIDDEIILKQKNIYIEHKSFLFQKKYNEMPYVKFISNESAAVYINNIFLENIEKRGICLDFIRAIKDELIIEGRCFSLYNFKNNLYIKNDNNLYKGIMEIVDTGIGRVLNQKMLMEQKFTFVIPVNNLKNKSTLEFVMSMNDKRFTFKKIVTKKHFPIDSTIQHSYVKISDKLISITNKGVMIEKSSLTLDLIYEFRYLRYLMLSNRIGARKFFVLRSLYYLLKPLVSKDIWLISDRINKADDNGEAFFKFLSDKKLHKNSYFVIQKKSLDYSVVKKFGKVLNYYSLKHRLIHLLAKKVISSAGDEYVFCPFWGAEYIKDILFHQQKIFLQHGITKDDISAWLNRYNKNLDLFITAGKAEYDSILNGNYFYNGNVVKLTGFARYDRLENKREKVITIMPTWRASLTQAGDYAITGKDNYNDDFFKSDYFSFYNNLINHSQLLACAKKYGYKIKFMPHPRVIPYVDRFTKNDLVEFCHIDTKYRDIFSESALVLTDYSSVAFDFAYLRKPVIYAQFDKEEFFRGQIYDQGYFDYERYGFGEVEYNIEDVVQRIIEYIKNDCQLKDCYRQRIDKFFAFNDRNNCYRIYDEIIKL